MKMWHIEEVYSYSQWLHGVELGAISSPITSSHRGTFLETEDTDGQQRKPGDSGVSTALGKGQSASPRSKDQAFIRPPGGTEHLSEQAEPTPETQVSKSN